MSILDANPSLSQDNDVNSDASIIKMLDEMLAQDNFAVQVDYLPTVFLLVETDPTDENKHTVIDTYETRAAAYRGAIDCLIESCVFAWDQGDES